MATRPPRACRKPGCKNTAQDGTAYCPHHYLTSKPTAWATSTASRHERGYDNNWYKMARVVRSEEPICRVCERSPTQQVDHIVPKAQGGTDDRSNLQGICKACHARKTASEGKTARGVV